MVLVAVIVGLKYQLLEVPNVNKARPKIRYEKGNILSYLKLGAEEALRTKQARFVTP